ncbi:unnamed protein product [Camellia sinensis]
MTHCSTFSPESAFSEMMTNHNHTTYLQLSSAPPDHQIFPRFPSLGVATANHQNPRKKRTKLIPIGGTSSSGGGVATAKPKCGKKPDPSAPKITRPCSECGKKFWSWKALFGHMRCHPERQWRGINPPPNFRRPTSPEISGDARMTPEDHEVAACLLMLANSPTAFETQCAATTTATMLESDTVVVRDDKAAASGGGGDGDNLDVNCRFECSSCKKVFGSHQALGGHRASHKNVKGCFAITRSDGEEVVALDHERSSGGGGGEGEVVMRENGGEEEDKMVMVLGHKCSICLRVFSSGQALGGHKRCHWEKGDEPSSQGLNPYGPTKSEGCCDLDLNLPAPVEDDSSSSFSSGLALDLRLGL